MIWGLPAYILFFVIILLYFIRPSWVLLLWLITTPLIAPVMVLFTGLNDFQDVQLYVWSIWGIYNRAYLLIILIELFIKGSKLKGNLNVLIVPGAVLALYLTFHNLVTYPNFMSIIGQYIGIIYTIPPMIALMLNKRMWPSIKSIYIVVVVVYLFEILWIPLNANGIYAYATRYQELMQGELSLVCGTFTRSNMLADYVAITYFFIMLDYFTRKSTRLIWFVLISVLALVLLFSAGSKLPIVVTVLGFMICIFLFRKEKISLVLASLAGLLGLLFILSTNTKEINTENEGLNRIVGELSSFIQARKNGDIDNSTFSISGEVIERYFWNSPIIGNGYSYKYEDVADAYPVSFGKVDLKADATFAYYLAEYGILGTLFFMFFYYNVIKCACYIIPNHRKKIILAIFMFFLLFSATEGGLFNRPVYTYVYMFLFAATRYYYDCLKQQSESVIKIKK